LRWELNGFQNVSRIVRPYNTLLKAVQDARIFKRNKRPLRSEVLACLLYLSGPSHRGMTYQTGMIDASHVSVYRWVHAMRRIVSRVPVRERKVVAMDETKARDQREAGLRLGCHGHGHERASSSVRILLQVVRQLSRLPQESTGNMH